MTFGGQVHPGDRVGLLPEYAPVAALKAVSELVAVIVGTEEPLTATLAEWSRPCSRL